MTQVNEQERELTDFEKAVLATFDNEEGEDGGQEEQEQPEEPEIEDGQEDEGAGEGDEDGDEEQPKEDHLEDVYDFNGRELREEELRQALELNDYFRSLPEEAITAVNALLTGDYVLVHRDHAGQFQQQEPKPPAGTAPPDDEEPIDPQAHARIQELERRLQTQDESRQQAEKEAAQRLQQEQVQLLRSGRDEFAGRHTDLSQDEIQGLWANVAKTGSLTPSLVSEHGGDLAAAMDAALEQAYWANENYRQREIERALVAQREANTEKRKRRAASSSLAGKGGSAPRQPRAPQTKDERMAAMTAELSAAMNGGQEA